MNIVSGKKMNNDELTAKHLAIHYKKGRKELAEKIIKTIRKREYKSDIGTITRIYSYCKKQIRFSDEEGGSK